MLYSGLVSITFRNLGCERIIELVKNSGLNAIEWGGDIHVPHGNLEKAEEVGHKTREADLKIAAYGSYYRVGCDNKEIGAFSKVLNTALKLEAPTIRVWAGDKGSDEADSDWWEKVVEESRKIADMAADKNIKIAFEYHGGTLTDTDESALKLIKKINHPNIYSYWQPPHNMSLKERAQTLNNILPWLENVHVFYWTNSPERKRYALAQARNDWLKYFEIMKKTDKDHFAMLEFVKGDNPDQFKQDALTLKNLINRVNNKA